MRMMKIRVVIIFIIAQIVLAKEHTRRRSKTFNDDRQRRGQESYSTYNSDDKTPPTTSPARIDFFLSS